MLLTLVYINFACVSKLLMKSRYNKGLSTHELSAPVSEF